MTLTRELLDTRYAWWFHNKRNAEQAKREILIIFSKELDDCFEWTQQDIYEQFRKIGPVKIYAQNCLQAPAE